MFISEQNKKNSTLILETSFFYNSLDFLVLFTFHQSFGKIVHFMFRNHLPEPLIL